MQDRNVPIHSSDQIVVNANAIIEESGITQDARPRTQFCAFVITLYVHLLRIDAFTQRLTYVLYSLRSTICDRIEKMEELAECLADSCSNRVKAGIVSLLPLAWTGNVGRK
jgi:hypothetical protein